MQQETSQSTSEQNVSERDPLPNAVEALEFHSKCSNENISTCSHLLMERQQVQNGVTYAKPHVIKLRLNSITV